jgi:Mrp family chromosome partitioning ATPase
MGRMLDTLKKAGGPLLRPDAPPSAPPLTDGCVLEWAVSEEQIPFIEVGGPNKAVEGSADVLAAHPAQPQQPPHPPTEKGLAKSALMGQAPLGQAPLGQAATGQRAEARPLAVAYEPWTGIAAGSRRIAPEVIVYHQPAHAVSRQYTELIGRIAPGGSAALVISGVKPHVGTTTVALNLAVAAALAGRRVLLVDAHLGRPGIAARLGIEPHVGIEAVLAGKAALDDALLPTVAPALQVLPAKAPAVESLLSHDAAAWLLQLLRPRFEVLLLDGPAFASTALAALAPCCDALYLVAPRGDEVVLDRAALHGLTRQGAQLRGVLHTHLA